MTWEEIQAWLNENKDTDEVKGYMKSYIETDGKDYVKSYLEGDGKGLVQPILDRTVTKAIDTWKENNLSKIVEEEVGKRNPKETAEQKQLRELRAEIDKIAKEKTRESLKNKAMTIATQKGLPVSLVDYFVGQDEDTTTANLSTFEQEWGKGIQSAVSGKFKDSARTPQQGNGSPSIKFTRDDVANMSHEEVAKNLPQIHKDMENW